MFKLEIGRKWPWVRRHQCPVLEAKFEPRYARQAWVRLPDGRMGIIDHLKVDGKLGVRPVMPDGSLFPNPAAHWSQKDRKRIPEEIAVDLSVLRPLPHKEIPAQFRQEL